MGSKKSTNSNSGGGGRGDGRKETNRRRNEINPNVIKGGVEKVKKKLGFTAVGGLGGDNKGFIAANLKGKNLRGKNNKLFYGNEASQFTNEYLESIGEAKKGNAYKDHKGNITGYSYFLTSKGNKMKYGIGGTAMGGGDNSGIMSSIPISEQMFERQRKLQSALIAGLSFAAGPIGGTIMRMAAADTYNSKYSDSLNKFNKNMSKSFEARNTGGNEQASRDSANLAFGNTDTTQVANKSKTSKKFKKYLAGTGSDESSNKRTFYS
jgi:hypothetical protein